MEYHVESTNGDNHNLNDEPNVTTADDNGNECDLRDSIEKQDGRSTKVFVPESKIRNYTHQTNLRFIWVEEKIKIIYC